MSLKAMQSLTDNCLAVPSIPYHLLHFTGHVIPREMKGRFRPLRWMVVSALISALLVASAWIAIPVGNVPITLQVLLVILTGLLLPPLWAGAAILVYLLLGAFGLPVFSLARGGLAIFWGPTGGYLYGFLPAAVLGAFLRQRFHKGRNWIRDGLAALLMLGVIYFTGWLHLMNVSGLTPWLAFLSGVAPFLWIDLLKSALAVWLAGPLRQVLLQG
jgi:biotin transport system substrate-specific component